jgi:hypothetical protein
VVARADLLCMDGPRITPEIVAGLELARRHFADLIDARSPRCRVGATDGLHEVGPRCECCGAGISDSTIKDAIAPWFQTWALFPFDTALRAIKGEASEGELSYLRAVSEGVAAGM